jgi:hypothetical protein
MRASEMTLAVSSAEVSGSDAIDLGSGELRGCG